MLGFHQFIPVALIGFLFILIASVPIIMGINPPIHLLIIILLLAAAMLYVWLDMNR